MLALLLIAWCAGTGCLLASYAHERASNDVTSSVAPPSQEGWGGLSAAAGDESSCHAIHHRTKVDSVALPSSEDVSLSEPPTSSESTSCCPLMSASFVAGGRSHVDEDTVASATGDRPAGLPSLSALPEPLEIPLRLPNQNQTYLRVCNLLI